MDVEGGGKGGRKAYTMERIWKKSYLAKSLWGWCSCSWMKCQWSVLLRVLVLFESKGSRDSEAGGGRAESRLEKGGEVEKGKNIPSRNYSPTN